MKCLQISVIIPTFKPQEYIWKCLDSLYNQTLDKALFEIILVLNGCKEPWYREIEKWQEEHPELQIKLIQADTPGVSNARNIGMDLAKGEYIAFIDDDDYVSPEYLEFMLDASDGDAIVLANSKAFVEGKPGWIETYDPALAYSKCSKRCDQNLLHARAIFNGPCMKLLQSNFIYGFQFDTSLTNGEDGLFMFEITKKKIRLRYANPEAVYYRRYRSNSATTLKKKSSFYIKNTLRLTWKYLKVWARAPFSYNFLWTSNRLLANLKNLIWRLRKSPLNQ